MYGATERLSQLGRGQACGVFMAALLALGSGCASHKPRLDEAMRVERGSGDRNAGVPAQYEVHYPDVLEVSIPGRTEEAVRCPIGLDGRLQERAVSYARVEGETVGQVRQALSEQTSVPEDEIDVRVAEYHSQHIYVWGPGVGLQHAVPYRGPETVLDFLERIGGVKAGAANGDIHVVRDGVVENRPPEVYHVDLKAIILDHDSKSNIRLQPFDQVYVGETRASFVEHCIPRWVRPLYDKICGLPRSRILRDKGDQNKSQRVAADSD
jgi:protein involved in polysaccharide export with SLBB domain